MLAVEGAVANGSAPVTPEPTSGYEFEIEDPHSIALSHETASAGTLGAPCWRRPRRRPSSSPHVAA